MIALQCKYIEYGDVSYMNNLYAIQDIIQYNYGIGNKLTEICDPIFSNFGFTSFGYSRIQKNGDRLILETNKDWLNYYSDIDFKEKKEGSSSLIGNLENLILDPPSEEFHIQMLIGSPKSKLHEQLCVLNVWNSVSIYVNMNKYLEVYHLSMSKEDNGAIVDLCLNKKFLLHRFFHYFRDKLCDLEIENAPYIRDDDLSKIFSQNGASTAIASSTQSTNNASLNSFLHQTYIDRFYLRTHDIFISRREAQCLHYLSIGKTCKEVGSHLKISQRTVESYINTLKIKTNLHSKGELIKLAFENHLASPGLFDCLD